MNTFCSVAPAKFPALMVPLARVSAVLPPPPPPPTLISSHALCLRVVGSHLVAEAIQHVLRQGFLSCSLLLSCGWALGISFHEFINQQVKEKSE